MPDQSSAADEHALLQEITAPLDTLPDDPVSLAADVDFPLVLRGYDRLAVDAYVKKTSQLVAELQATRSPDAAIRRAIERVGEQISGILQRAHETAEQITTQSRREAEDRLQVARSEGARITAAAEQRLKDLDADTDRIWAERQRIVDDSRDLARQLVELAEAAAERFPPASETEVTPGTAVPPGADDRPLPFDSQNAEQELPEHGVPEPKLPEHEVPGASHEVATDQVAERPPGHSRTSERMPPRPRDADDTMAMPVLPEEDDRPRPGSSTAP